MPCMPLIIKDFTWRQTERTIVLRVPLKGVHPSKVDVFTSSIFIKAHFQPYFFEVFLSKPIDCEKSKCILNDTEAVFELIKTEEKIWEFLESDIDKLEKNKLRQQIFEEAQKQAEEKSEAKIKRKYELDRFSVSEAMKEDSKMHEVIEKRRNAQRDAAMNNLEDWRKATCKDNFNRESKRTATITEINDNEENLETVDISNRVKQKLPSFIQSESFNEKIKPRSEFVSKKMNEVKNRVLPEVRKNTTLNLTFTERAFPTPSRESIAEEEEQWLKNMNIARRATGFHSADLRAEEQDPQWCKDKGDEFYEQGNYLGAISAYSHGIKLSDKMPGLFSNRAAAHFAMGNFHKCTVDCSDALELLKPACDLNLLPRVKCIVRRAAALCRMGMLNKAIIEMKIASRMKPNDEKIIQDLKNMESAWEQDPDSE